MQLSVGDQIWNPAALESGGKAPRAGDRALADLLLAHGLVMNGGIGHAIEAMSREEFLAALSGYRFFGLDAVASLLERASGANEHELEHANSLYGNLVPSDDVLVERFEHFYRNSPEVFSPLPG